MNLIITGKVASGKSEVLNILKECGFSILDADKVVHQLYTRGEKGYKNISKYIGRKYCNPFEVDRKLLLKDLVDQKISIETVEDVVLPFVYEKINKINSRSKNTAIEIVNPDMDKIDLPIDNVIWIDRRRSKIHKVMKNRGYSDKEFEYLYGLAKRPNKSILVENNARQIDLKRIITRLIK